MSLILNFETSSKNCSVTLSSEGKLISNFDLEDDKYRHSELLTSTIKDILNQNNISAKDLSAVAIGIGPGSAFIELAKIFRDEIPIKFILCG